MLTLHFYYQLTNFKILGIKWWSGSDRDLYPEGDSIEETHQYIEEIIEYVYELQQKTLLKPLWLTADLQTHKR